MNMTMDLSPEPVKTVVAKHFSFQQSEVRCLTCGNLKITSCALCDSVKGANEKIVEADDFSTSVLLKFFGVCLAVAVVIGAVVGVLR